MRQLLMLFVLIFTLGFGGQALAEQNSTNDQSTSMNSQSSQEQGEFSAFEADDLNTDDWGVYDEDFVWETDEDWYSDWYGDASDYWEDWEPWGNDDPGEAGWFDW